MSEQIHVVLADDRPVVRQGIRRFLEEDEVIEVVAEASAGAEAVSSFSMIQRRALRFFRSLQFQLLLWAVLPVTFVIIALAFTRVYAHQRTMRRFLPHPDRSRRRHPARWPPFTTWSTKGRPSWSTAVRLRLTAGYAPPAGSNL